MTAYYNEIDPYAAAWLRNLIAAGHIAPGDVDERSIEDVRPEDLRKYNQCHFFAGIGVWSAALRGAGWSDDRPVWTGSCPCQPFSAAGKGDGFDDERHLWPAWQHLIAQCRPPVVFGEQVASKDGLGWLDLVQTDMEGTGYAFWPVDLCAAGVGAPHIRQRLYFVADTSSHRFQWEGPRGEIEEGRTARSEFAGKLPDGSERHGAFVELENAIGFGSGGQYGQQPEDGRIGELASTQSYGRIERQSLVRGRQLDNGKETTDGHRHNSPDGVLADTDGSRSEARIPAQGYRQEGDTGEPDDRRRQLSRSEGPSGASRPGPTNGHWRDPDWLFCRDGKWRPVESGTFPLAHGAPARVGRLRAYGNAIVKEAAQAVICSYIDHETFRSDIENCEFI